MLTIAIANAKGGVGKTSTSVHLATGFARSEGKRVLLVDLDPQGNASTWLLGKVPPDLRGAYEILTSSGALTDAIYKVPDRDIHIAASTPKLRQVDFEIAHKLGGQMVLRRALESLKGLFDVVILDCPPNLGVTVMTALCAADAVLTPVLPAFLSLSGIDQLEELVLNARQLVGVPTQILGYFLFASDRREVISREAAEIIAKKAGNRLFHTQVRVSTVARALPAGKKLAWDQGYDTRGRTDYGELLKETIERLEGLGFSI